MNGPRIGILGAAGRMGRILLKTLLETPGATLAGGSERPGSPAVGRDIGSLLGRENLGLLVGDDAKALIEASDAVIDFTSPAAAPVHAALAAERGIGFVLGTTGLSPAEEAAIRTAAGRCPLVWSPNMSVGVNLLLDLVEKVAAVLDPEFDIEILEMHHRHKVDAPSGTALGLGRAAAAGRQVRLDEVWRKSRDGHPGARPRGEIGFASLRGGDVVGDHTVIFAAEGERIELTHKASSRDIFARGAIRAALWAAGRKPGLYSMKDVLGL